MLDISRKQKEEERRFLAAIQGIDLDDDKQENVSDIVELQGHAARTEGFGIDEGLGFQQWGDDEWQE